MDNVKMADEVLPPLQNGDHSENGASIEPDVSEIILEISHPTALTAVETINEKDVLVIEDPVNETLEDREETPDSASKDSSLERTQTSSSSVPVDEQDSALNNPEKPEEDTSAVESPAKDDRPVTGPQVHTDNLNMLSPESRGGEYQGKKDGMVDLKYVSVPNTNSAASATVTSKMTYSPKKSTQVEEARGLVDTAAPFESVKEAVSKFGGIIDWKAHKHQTVERQKFVEQGLEKVREEIPQYKKTSEIAEDEKLCVLKELEGTKRLIEELKLNLERAQKEEHQAKQDSELAILRVEEMAQGIADESSVAAKSQLEVARARHVSAIAELKLAKDELDKFHKDYDELVMERDLAAKKSEEAIAALKEVEKTMEGLTVEMIAAKESLESAQAALVEAEEHRIGVAAAKEKDSIAWEKELKLAEEELAECESQIQAAKDLKSNLNSASMLLIELKGEMASYMESKLKQEVSPGRGGQEDESKKRTHGDLQVAIESSRKELEEAKLDIEKATAKVDYLKVAAASLQLELEKERSSLVATRQREGIATVTAASLESDLRSIQSEMELAQTKEKEAKDKMTELPKQLQQAVQEADDSKSLAQLACEELRKTEEEVEQVRAAACIMESRLLAAHKEIEASKASKNLALAAIKALQESESTGSINDADSSSSCVTISVEEYYELSKRAHEAEEQANVKVATAFSQVEVAKQSESRSLAKLKQLTKEIANRKESLEDAKEKAEEAKEGKLGVEDQLRKWRAEHERRRKPSESNQTPRQPDWSKAKRFDESRAFETNVRTSYAAPANYTVIGNPYVQESYSESESSTDVKVVKTKKGKLHFPRLFTFLAKRREARSFKSR